MEFMFGFLVMVIFLYIIDVLGGLLEGLWIKREAICV